MKQEEIIKKTKKPITKDDFINAFKELGIKEDTYLEVHSSLSAIGFIVNKAYDICDALLETITKGVVIMPGHTPEMTNPRDWENPPVPESWFDIIEKHRKPFDPKVFIPERVGQVSRVFMNYPGVKRTLHPEVSLLVYNQTQDPTWLNHSYDDRDLVHPYHKLKEEAGKILMIGTDFFTVTSIHLTEFMSDYSGLSHYDYQIKDGDQIIKKTITTKYFDDDDLNFKEISKRYIDKYQDTIYYKQVKLGYGQLTLIDAEKLYEIAKDFHINYQRD